MIKSGNPAMRARQVGAVFPVNANRPDTGANRRLYLKRIIGQE
jgi:hypothetical protein